MSELTVFSWFQSHIGLTGKTDGVTEDAEEAA